MDLETARDANDSIIDGVCVASVSEGSRFVRRLMRRYDWLPRWHAFLDAQAPNWFQSHNWPPALDRLRAQGLETGDSLRVLRQAVLARLIAADTHGHAGLDEVTQTLSSLASFVLQTASDAAQVSLAQRHGWPRNISPEVDAPQRASWLIVGMGKLGARELNASSDIDLVYLYDGEGSTSGLDEAGQPAAAEAGVEWRRGSISNSEYFTKLVRAIQMAVSEVNEHGFAFRIDTALRPNGNSGPVVCSLDALAQYFSIQGREWERLAWLKSRIVASNGPNAHDSAQQLRRIVLPFVFRRYLDYNVFDALRALHRQIRDHATRRAAGRPQRHNDIKLSRGGIREIEFLVQVLQVVRGGQYPELRTRRTQDGLTRLVAARLIPADVAQALNAAYVFLRQVEHRIQYLDDAQTHTLPDGEADLAWIAASMGLADTPAFLAQLGAHRETVAHEFDRLLQDTSTPVAAPAQPCVQCNKAETAQSEVQATRCELPENLKLALDALVQSPRVRVLREDAAQRLQKIVVRSIESWRLGVLSDTAIERSWLWLETLLKRDSYLSLLAQRPQVMVRVAQLLGAAKFAQRWLTQHPGLVDELAQAQWLDERFDRSVYQADLHERLRALKRTAQDDDESLMNVLRRAHHAETFRTLARDLAGKLSVEQVADDLSALADATLDTSMAWVWPRLKLTHQPHPALAVLAYGKLGGKELGYGSDLDLVFVYDDAHEQAGEIYAQFVRKLITFWTARTAEGDLFEIDTALRPNGNSGLLVTSLDAFVRYQTQRGSNAAWTWEHQAITRARWCAGSAQLRAPVEAVRQAVLTAPRDLPTLRQEIETMRERLRQAYAKARAAGDLKHIDGGLLDVEFAVQYLVLANAANHPSLADNVGNIALLQRAQSLGLLPAPVGTAAADAYRALRAQQHADRLQESRSLASVVPTASPTQSTAHQCALDAVWSLQKAIF